MSSPPASPSPSSPAPSLWATTLGSALSGSLARIPCHPLDTLKARIQAGPAGASLLSAARDALAHGGVRSLYRGFGVTFAGSAPASCLYFSTYEAAVRAAEGGPVPRVAAHLAAGMAAEAVAGALYCPLDVVKERMQVQGAQRRGGAGSVFYTSARDAFAQIVRSGEGLRGLYRGYGATLASFGPFSAIYFVLYEGAKDAAYARRGEARSGVGGSSGGEAPLPLHLQILIAAGAGAGASIATSPLDLVKLRLQVQRGSAAAAAATRAASASAPPFAYSGLWHGLVTIAREEGVAGLMRGAGARCAFHVPNTAVSLVLFERSRDLVTRHLLERSVGG